MPDYRDVQNYIKTLMARTPQQMIDKRFPTYREELPEADLTPDMLIDPKYNEFIEQFLNKPAPDEGSPADVVNKRFPGAREVKSIDATPGDILDPYVDTDKMLHYLTFGNMANEKGMQAFLESGPMSENIEDRRDESVMDTIKRYMSEVR
jgi:hypothetical protein